MKKTIFASLIVGLVGCIDATVTVPEVCSTSSSAIPVPHVDPHVVGPVTIVTSTPLYISETFTNLTDVTDTFDVNMTRFTLDDNVDLSWIASIDVSVKSEIDHLPDVSLATYKRVDDSLVHSIALTPIMDAETMQKYFMHPLTLTYTLKGIPPTSAYAITNTLCVSATTQIHKTL